MKPARYFRFGVWLVLAGVCRVTLAAPPPAEAIDRNLGDLTLEGQSLAAVLETLGQKAGVNFIVDDDTYAALPWGRETRLATLQLRRATLREALGAILRPLALTYSVGERSITISLSGPLARLNRRATWKDLDLLHKLDTSDYTPTNFAAIQVQYRITSKVNAPKRLATQLERAGDGTIAQILTAATAALGWTWFPDEDHIVVLSAQAHIAHNLARTVTARYNQMGLAHILLDLLDRADVPLFMEPGLMLKLPPSTAQHYSLLLQHTTIRQALELVCAETGLAYEVRRDGVYIGLSDALTATQPALARRAGDPYLAKITVPAKGGQYSYEFLIRESELPSDIREYRSQILDETIERMRQDLAPAPAEPAEPADAGPSARGPD